MHLAENIDLVSGVTGGVMVGLSSTILMYATGRITGVSGIVEGLIISKRGEESKTWMLIYVSGLLSAGAVIPSLLPAAFGSSSSASPPMVYNLPTIAVAALLTGFGTRLAKGCTSGHGICGIPRLSIRSLTAVLTFMATGAITAAVSRNTELKNRLMTGGELASFAADEDKTFLSSMVSNYLPTVATLVTTAALLNESFFLHSLFFPSKADAKAPASPDISFHDGLITYACGLLFGLGMGVSGMTNPERVVGFLNVGGASGWDPTLLGVMGGGVLFNLISFRIMHAYHHTIPLSSTRRSISQTIKMGLDPSNLNIDSALILGSAIFGVGWGLTGLCPAPAIVSLGASRSTASVFVPFMLAGMALKDLVMGGLTATCKIN